jgi:hypothetical protein
MPTNNYPGIGKKTQGKDFNFYTKLEISSTSFGGDSVDGYQPDTIITFPTQSVIFCNEETGSSKVVEYSFNGYTVHGELDPTLPSRTMTFDNRVISMIWFRVKSGSSGPLTIRIDSWGTR